MNDDKQQQTAAQCDVERRAIGRQHTANLLKVLRGDYGAPLPATAGLSTPLYETATKDAALAPVPNQILDPAPTHMCVAEALPTRDAQRDFLAQRNSATSTELLMNDAQQQQTAAQCDAERRAIGRQHTANLLKMLRGGYGAALPATAELSTPLYETATKDAALAPVPNQALDPAPTYICVAETLPSTLPSTGMRNAPALPSIGDMLRRPSEGLQSLMVGATALAEMRSVFLAYLRPELRDHAQLVRLDEDAWVVQTESAAWAVRLHYALHDMRGILGQHCGISLPKPQIHIAPINLRPQPPAVQRHITENAAACLAQAALQETDPRLSAVLQRLANRAKPTNTDHALHPPQQSS